MIDEIRKSISHVLYERITSPLAGTFIFTWFAWNWRIPYILLFSDSSMNLLSKIQYIEKNFITLKRLFYYPGLSTLAILIVYPLISHASFWYWLKMKVWKNQTKNKIEANDMITKEQYRAIKLEYKKIQDEFDQVLKQKDDKIEELTLELSVYKKPVNEKKKEVIIPKDDENKLTNQWEKEVQDFLKNEKVKKHLEKIALLIQRGGFFADHEVPSVITSYYFTKKLIKETDKAGYYKFTPKGEFFLEKYLDESGKV